MGKEKYGQEYFQKSEIFLLPLSGISNIGTFKPHGTYLYYSGEESIENYMLIVHYSNETQLFKIFEKELLKNPKLVSSYQSDRGRIYIFDLIQHAWDVACVVNGFYSEISNKGRAKILAYHNISSKGDPKPDKYAEIGVNPSKYYASYATQYGYTAKEMKSINKELILRPDNDLETFKGIITEKLFAAEEKTITFDEIFK